MIGAVPFAAVLIGVCVAAVVLELWRHRRGGKPPA
jgi:hypothetical protein